MADPILIIFILDQPDSQMDERDWFNQIFFLWKSILIST
jgi:hypothetical protein